MQMTTVITSKAGSRRRARLLAAGAALGLWAAIHLGIDLRSPASFGEPGATSATGPGQVAFVSAVAALAAWGLFAVLERLTAHGRQVWLVIAVSALVLSLGGAMSGTGLTTADRMELVGFHLLVAAVLIPLLYRTSPTRAAASTQRRGQLTGAGQTRGGAA